MNEIVKAGFDVLGLPALVERAAQQLASATSAAEILDARDTANFAYHSSKTAARLAKAKGAHDEIIAKAHRAQADALEIESMAKRRLADEYDAAQARGEVQKHGGQGKRDVLEQNIPSVEDIGLTRKDIHEARQIRDAETAEPGIVRRTLDASLQSGKDPTRADIKAAVKVVTSARSEQNTAQADSVKSQLPPHVHAYEQRKADAKVSKKAASTEELQARIDELEESQAILERDHAEIIAENKKFEAMRVLFEKGGFEAVIAAKDEEIRVLEGRVYSESQGKAEWLRKAEFWKKQAKQLGWRDTRFDAKAPPAEEDDFLAAIAEVEG